MSELYKEVDIVERTHITKEGKIQKLYRVSAFTKSDVLFSIDVKEKDFTKERIAELLTEQAMLIEDIKAL